MTQRQSKFSSIDVNASFFSNGKKKKTFIVQTFPLWSKVMILICCIIGLSGFFIREILEIIGPYAGVSFSKVENEKMKIRLEILRKEIHSFQEVATQVEEHSQKVFDEMISHVNKMKETREQQQIILTTGIEQIKHDVIEYTVQIVKTPPKIPPKTPPLPQQQQQQQQQQQSINHHQTSSTNEQQQQQQQQVQEIEKQKKKKQTIADALDLAAEEALEQFLSKENLDTLNDLDFHFEPIPKELEKAMINEKKSTNTAQVVIDTFSKPQVEESTEKAQQTITSNINTTTTTSIKSIIVGFLKKLQVVLIFFVTFTIALFMYDGNLRRDLKRRFFISSRTSRNNRFTRAYDSSEVETVRNSFSEDSETEDSATAEDDDVHNTTFIADLDDDENVDTYTSQVR
jgi:hypothetical protein